jgi:hypothetical protein
MNAVVNDGAVKLIDLGNKIETKEQVASQAAHIEEKRSLAYRLGLHEQERFFARDIELLEKPKLTIDPMSADEKQIWNAFLPKTYEYYPPTDSSYGNKYDYRGGGSAVQYSFDRIPHPVLAKWNECVEQKLFDKYEIWTPEKVSMPDPVLVGYIGERCYMVARWAESDANLVDISTIKRKLVKDYLFTLDAVVGTGVVTAIAGTVISLLAVLFQDSALSWTRFGINFAFAGPAVLAALGAATAHSFYKNPLMKAIIRHKNES